MLDKARKKEKVILRLERRIHELEEQVEEEKSNRIVINEFKDYILATQESHSNSQRIFYEKDLGFQEATLKVLILFKTTQVDESVSLQISRDLEFIKQDQQSLAQGNQNIRILEVEELKKKIMELKYLIEIIVENMKQIEDIYLNQKKIQDLINENLQQIDLLEFRVFDDFKEK